MKSKITSTNKILIRQALNNPLVMEIENTKKIREAVATEVKKLVSNLHNKK